MIIIDENYVRIKDLTTKPTTNLILLLHYSSIAPNNINCKNKFSFTILMFLTVLFRKVLSSLLLFLVALVLKIHLPTHLSLKCSIILLCCHWCTLSAGYFIIYKILLLLHIFTAQNYHFHFNNLS